jgi:hypothetical protein
MFYAKFVWNSDRYKILFHKTQQRYVEPRSCLLSTHSDYLTLTDGNIVFPVREESIQVDF